MIFAGQSSTRIGCILLATASLLAVPCNAEEPPPTDVVVPGYAHSLQGASAFWTTALLVTNTTREAGVVTVSDVFPAPGFSSESVRLGESWDIAAEETIEIYPLRGHPLQTPFAGSLRVTASVAVRVEAQVYSSHSLAQFVFAVPVADFATSAIIPSAPLGFPDPRVNLVIVSPSSVPNRVRVRMIFTLTGEVVHDDVEFLDSRSTIVRPFRPRVPVVFDGFGGTYRIELSSDFPILCGASMFRDTAATYVPCSPMPDWNVQPAGE
ncbi:MAG: hypothetical protein ACYC7A_16330 [Thermoanaerobaculia bacterium]